MRRIRRFILLFLIFVTGIKFRPIDKEITTKPYRRLSIENVDTVLWFNFHRVQDNALRYLFNKNVSSPEDTILVNVVTTGVKRELFPDVGNLALTMRTSFLFRASDRVLSILLLESYLEHIRSLEKKS